MLRPYQAQLKAGVYQCWSSGHRNVLAVSPTGSGKTVLFSDILSEYQGASVAIAHRQELVAQISVALAREHVRHGILAPKAVIREIVSLQMAEVGRSYYEPNARCKVAGVDTLTGHDPKDPWCAQVGLWVQDEAHHLLLLNKWGKATQLFPNAYGLGVTATAVRADGKGLGRESDGLMDSIVLGPTMRELILEGFLTPYRIFAPPVVDLDLSQVAITPGGDFSPEPLRNAVHASHIVGDVVEHYLRIAPGKKGVTFAVDIEGAKQIAEAFNKAGVRAAIVSSKTAAKLRVQILRDFRNGLYDQLVNVDLFGEGFDLPAIEVVSFARPTASYGLYVQQFGRALRILEGKTHAIIIDHVGNVHRHGLPDAPRVWSLNRRQRRSSSPDDAIPTKTCVKCLSVFERTHKNCPYCGHYEPPALRSAPEHVDGDLYELSEDTLAVLRGEVDRIDGAPTIPRSLDSIAAAGLQRRHWERQQAQNQLRHTMMLWGGGERAGKESEAWREFYLRFKIDVLSAMALGAREAGELEEKIRSTMR